MFQKSDVRKLNKCNFSGNVSFRMGSLFIGYKLIVLMLLLTPSPRPQQRARRGRIIWTDEDSKGAAQVILSSDWSERDDTEL